MSRGIGQTQREIIRVLRDADGPLYACELRRRAGVPDPTNARRSIRSLVQRGTVERDDEGRAALTFTGSWMASVMDEPPEPEPLDELRRGRRQLNRDLAQARARAIEDVLLYREEEARWQPTRYHRVRHKQPGDVEYRVLAAIARYSPHVQVGLPRAAVVEIAEAGDPARIRRAIHSLLDRAELQESIDEYRIRVPVWYDAFLYEPMWDLVRPPLDDIKAQVVLEGYGEYLDTYPEGA